MEGIAVGIAKKALDSVLSTAKTAITDDIGLLFGVQEELFFIKEELEMMQAFLRVASAEEAKGEIVTTWVRQVQELSYDVEDCLQEASVHLMKKGCLNNMLSFKARDRIAQRIKVLKVRIEDVSKRNLRYGLIKSSNRNVPVDSMEKHVPYSTANDESLIVGLTKPKQDLLQLIRENSDTRKVISVVGMGGCGKTTLVKNVLESPELRNQFQCFAWITIVHPFIADEFVINLAMELSLLDQDEKTRVIKNRWFNMQEMKERRLDMAELKTKISMHMKDKKYGGGLIWRRLNMVELKTKINKHMKDKKYAIVLDDLASETEWNEIRSIFPIEVKGSRFLVTTRCEDLAKKISKQQDIYKLPKLSIDESLELFYRAVYKNSDYALVTDGKSKYKLKKSKEGEQPEKNLLFQIQIGNPDLQQEITPKQDPFVFVTEEMKTQACEIIERCGKLPLAIVAIGSFLATRPKTSDEWNKMHEHISSEIHNNPHLGSIMNSLTTSYDGLPYHLKSCFLYLCVFPNHHKIRRSRIIRRWMAEGFVMQGRDMIAEEVGERYFYELMSRNLIQPSASIAVGNDIVAQCSIHDLLYEMIVRKSENENVVSFVRDQRHMSISGKARHVVIQGGLEEKNSALENRKLTNIRSVTGFGKVRSYIAYHKMRLLRVLDLEGTMGLKNRDIRKICKLHHLKYLGLRGTAITKLPGSLEKLHDLETLDIRDTRVLDLPKGVVKLKKLSYLRAGFDYEQNPKLYNRYICGNYLEEAYERPEQWTNYGAFGLKAPQGTRKMRFLHTFGSVDIGQSIASAKELKFLSNLRKIAIVGFSKKNGKVLGEAIEKLVHLKSLILAASDKLGLGCCLDSINTPPMFLRNLELLSPINKLPNWFRSLGNLVKLYIRNTELPMEAIKEFEMLSNLKILYILENSFRGEQLCFGPDTFKVLQVMYLDSTKLWSRSEMPLKVMIEETALQKLAHLTIHGKDSRILSSQLESRNKGSNVSVPRWELQGLENLKSLKEVVLDDLNIDVVKSVKDMISRNPNEPDVRCLNIPTMAEESV